MKKTSSTRSAKRNGDDLAPEYRFDYSKAKPNRFAKGLKQGGRIIALDPDVADVFKTQDCVNSVLRALISTIPSAKDSE